MLSDLDTRYRRREEVASILYCFYMDHPIGRNQHDKYNRVLRWLWRKELTRNAVYKGRRRYRETPEYYRLVAKFQGE